MRLWTKVIILSLALIVSFIVVIVGASTYFYGRSYTRIEQENAALDLQRLDNAVQSRLMHLALSASDWAYWDDAYAFMADGNQHFIDTNLVYGTFDSLKVDIIAFVNTGNVIVWAKCYDRLGAEKYEIPPSILDSLTDGSLSSPAYYNPGFRGILRTDASPMLFAVQPVMTSLGEGPARGFVFMGYFLDDAVTGEIAEELQISLSLAPYAPGDALKKGISANSPSVVEIGKDTITGHLLLNDSRGNPYIVASTKAPRTIYEQGMRVVGWFNVVIVVCVVLGGALALYLAKVWMMSHFQRMEKAITDIARSGDFSMRVPVNVSDMEMNRIAGAVNFMLDRLCDVQSALKVSEGRYSTILENMSDGVTIIEDGKCRYINRRFTELLGIDPSEAIDQPFIKWVATENREHTQAAYVSRMDGKEAPACYRSRLVRSDGHEIPVEISARIITVNGIKTDIVLMHDTTERDRMEKALQESEARYKLLADNSADVIWLHELTDGDSSKHLYVSPSVERMLGYTPEEYCRLSDAQVLTPSSLQLVTDRITVEVAGFDATGKLSNTLSMMLDTVHKNGTVVPVEIAVSLLSDASGKAVRVLGISRDISKRIKMEEELRARTALLEAVLNASVLGILVAAGDGTVLWENESNRRLWGFSHGELKFNSLEERVEFLLTKVKHREQFTEKVRAVASDTNISFRDEMELVNGTIMERYTAPVLGKDGQHYGRIWSFHDVTGYKKIEEELRSKTAFLEAQLNSSINGVLVVDHQGRVLLENEANVRLWKFSHKNLEFTTLENRVKFLSTKVKDPVTFYSTVMILMSSSTATRKDEFELLDGTVIERYSTPVIGENGVNYGRIWLYHDITGLKKIEEELRAKTAFLEAQLNASTEGVLVTADDGNIILENESNARIWGFRHKDVAFTNLDERIKMLAEHVKDTECVTDVLNSELSSPLTVIRDEIELANGTTVERYSAPVLDGDGVHYGRIWTFHDVTERKKNERALKQSEQNLAEIIQKLPIATLVINKKHEISAWNQEMEKLTGIKAADMLGKGNYEYALPFYAERRPILADLLLDGDDSVDKKYVLVVHGQEGSRGEVSVPKLREGGAYLLVTASLIRDADGRVAGAIESLADITEVRESEKLLMASLQEKETLLKEIHHRVKNNMQVISSLLALQSQFVHDKADEQLFQDSQERIRSMALVYNKLYQSKTLATIDMKEYVTELATNLVNSYSIERERLKLNIDVGAVSLGIEHAIPCGLIVNELLVNVMKHAFPDGRFGEVHVSMHMAERSLSMEVRDNGVGLPEAFDIATSPTLGVGLVHSLGVDQLGGSVEFMRLERGTRVAINFSLE